MEFLQKVTSCVIIAIYVDINNITYAAEWHDTPPILASQKGQLTPKKAACVHTMVSSNKATNYYQVDSVSKANLFLMIWLLQVGKKSNLDNFYLTNITLALLKTKRNKNISSFWSVVIIDKLNLQNFKYKPTKKMKNVKLKSWVTYNV